MGALPDRVPGSAPQSKPLEELSELYASAADAQEAAVASSDPALARERLQAVLRDIAGAASFPAIAGEHPPALSSIPLLARVCFLPAQPLQKQQQRGVVLQPQPSARTVIEKHQPRVCSITTP